MAETTAVQTVGSRRATVLLGLLVVGVAAVALTAWISGLERSPGWSGPVYVVVTACLIAAIMALTRSWRDRPAWVAAVGLALVAVGSGIGRPREEITTHVAPGTEFDRGDVIGRLDTWWVLVVIGLLLCGVAAVWALRISGARSSGTLAAASLLAVGLGYTVVAIAMRDLVVGMWVSGRPLRGTPCRTGPPRRVAGRDHPADLWQDAAEDEAEAVAAFSSVAARLTGVGAPASLVRRCHEAALEEGRHAAACLVVAGRLGSRPPADQIAPGTHRAPKSTASDARRGGRTVEILRLATESFVDGVVGEGFAGRRLQEGSRTVGEGQGPRLRSMALEELRHAALAADIVTWALQEHPTLVRGALRRAVGRLPAHTEVPASHRVFSPDQLQRVGMVDGEAADELWRQGRAAALHWLDDMLAAQLPALDGIRRSAAR